MTNEPKTTIEKSTLSDLISKLDVDAVGIASVAEWKGTKLEETTLKLLPEARSVVVFAMEIYPELLDLVSPGKIMGVASLNDLLDRNADFLNGRLTKAAYNLAKASRSMGLKALPLPATLASIVEGSIVMLLAAIAVIVALPVPDTCDKRFESVMLILSPASALIVASPSPHTKALSRRLFILNMRRKPC